MRKNDQSLIYYGPHPCQECDQDGKSGTLIVRAVSKEGEVLAFNFVHDSHYPNHKWKRHVCHKNEL